MDHLLELRLYRLVVVFNQLHSKRMISFFRKCLHIRETTPLSLVACPTSGRRSQPAVQLFHHFINRHVLDSKLHGFGTGDRNENIDTIAFDGASGI